MRNRENFNADVPSDEEDEVYRPPPTAPKNEDTQSNNISLVSEKSTLSKKEDNSSRDQNESRDSLPQLVLPAVNKDGKTPRRGTIFSCAKSSHSFVRLSVLLGAHLILLVLKIFFVLIYQNLRVIKNLY